MRALTLCLVFATSLAWAPPRPPPTLEEALDRVVFSSEVLLALRGRKPLTFLHTHPAWMFADLRYSRLRFREDAEVILAAVKKGRLTQKQFLIVNMGEDDSDPRLLFVCPSSLRTLLAKKTTQGVLERAGYTGAFEVDPVVAWARKTWNEFGSRVPTKQEKAAFGLLYGYGLVDVLHFAEHSERLRGFAITAPDAQGHEVVLYVNYRGLHEKPADEWRALFTETSRFVAEESASGSSYRSLWNRFDAQTPGALPQASWSERCSRRILRYWPF